MINIGDKFYCGVFDRKKIFITITAFMDDKVIFKHSLFEYYLTYYGNKYDYERYIYRGSFIKIYSAEEIL
jgi:hypothetical protein